MLKGNHVVRLQHTELGGYLTSDDLDFTNDNLAEVYVRVHNDKSDEFEGQSSGDLFEIEIASDYDRGKVCVWSDENDEKNKHKYRLRHLNSGRLVKTQEVTISDSKLITIGLADHLDEANANGKVEGFAAEVLDLSLFKLLSTTIDHDNRIRSGSSLKIESAKSRGQDDPRLYLNAKYDQEWTGGVQGGTRAGSSLGPRKPNGPKNSIDDLLGELNQKNDLETSVLKGTRNKGKSTGIYHPLDDEELYNCKYNVIELTKFCSNEHAFMITLVDQKEVSDVLFFQTVSAELYRYTRYLRANKMNEITDDVYQNIIHILSKMIFFVTVTESSDPVN